MVDPTYKKLQPQISPIINRGEYFSKKPIFLHTPKIGPARESRDTLVPGQYYFCTKPKKGNFSAHSSNISAQSPKKAIFLHIVTIYLHGPQRKCYFYAQSNKKLAICTT